MKRKILFLLLISIVALIVWGLINGNKSLPLSSEVRERLLTDSSFEVLAINPVAVPDSELIATNADVVLRYLVLGRVKIDNQKTRQELVNAVGKDIAKANHPPTACILEPRHGIRVGDGTNTMVMLICYRCGDVVLEQNGKTKDYLIKMGSSLRSPNSLKLFERILKQAGIKTDSN